MSSSIQTCKIASKSDRGHRHSKKRASSMSTTATENHLLIKGNSVQGARPTVCAYRGVCACSAGPCCRAEIRAGLLPLNSTAHTCDAHDRPASLPVHLLYLSQRNRCIVDSIFSFRNSGELPDGQGDSRSLTLRLPGWRSPCFRRHACPPLPCPCPRSRSACLQQQPHRRQQTTFNGGNER